MRFHAMKFSGVWPDKWVCNGNAKHSAHSKDSLCKVYLSLNCTFCQTRSRCQPVASLRLGAFRSGNSLFYPRACCDTMGNALRRVLFAKIILSEAVSGFPVGLQICLGSVEEFLFPLVRSGDKLRSCHTGYVCVDFPHKQGGIWPKMVLCKRKSFLFCQSYRLASSLGRFKWWMLRPERFKRFQLWLFFS